jgi:polyhydroxyalkanoate synthase subunit PhaC
MSAAPEVEERAADHAAPFDVMLADAALGSVRRWLPGTAGLRFATSLATRPRTVARRGGSLIGELRRIATGTSQVEPSKRDRRFQDPAWSGNPVLHRVVQAYLSAGQMLECLVGDAGLDWRSEARMRFLVDNVVEALAPSNSPVLNPTALKAAIDTGGRNFARGAANLARDLATPPRVPSMVDPRPFQVGGNLAVTPGAVVLRTPIMELLQYQPQTDRVRDIPLLMVPPTINKYYIADLAPDRSMVEYFVRSGQQVFMISWRNPDARHADWGLDRYAGAVLDALDAVERICSVDRAILLGLCSGGIITSLVLGHLAGQGELDRVAGVTLGVTVLDQSRAGLPSAVLDRRVADLAAARSARRGYLDGRGLAEMFAWLRPGDLVWNYWVNNYLLGKDPAPFDILFWNSDTTRMSARLHRDFLTLAVRNSLITPGDATVLGTPVDLGAVKLDAYVVAGIADHICPWESCYRTTQLLGGQTRFVLSTSGHIAALVNPPGNPKARYQVNEDNPPDPQQWLRRAGTETGSWWDDYVRWLRDHSGPERPAPDTLGGGGLEPLDAAPGTYVCDR